MSDVASLELCKELYELSEHTWLTEDPLKWVHIPMLEPMPIPIDHKAYKPEYYLAEAYTLGYLLRKLPANFNTGNARGSFEFFLKTTGREWFAGYNKPELGKWLYDESRRAIWQRPCNADTPEDALCKLAIELFKQGVLKTGEK